MFALFQTVSRIPASTILLYILPLAVTEDVHIVYPNHRYEVNATWTTETPRTIQRPSGVHFTQRTPLKQAWQHRNQSSERYRNISLTYPSKLSLVKRSGDYQYDYPQYEVDDHAAPWQVHGHGQRMPALRTMPYPRFPMYDRPASRFDFPSIGTLAIIKLVILKILSFGLFKLVTLLLLKLPIVLFLLGFKFLIILKLIKLVKLLTIPIIIPIILVVLAPVLLVLFFLLLPLLLAPLIPLILIPILLPLLLSIPVPVLAPTGRRRRRQAESDLQEIQSRSVQDDVLYLVRRVLESEQCIERVACQFATNKQSQGFAAYVAW